MKLKEQGTTYVQTRFVTGRTHALKNTKRTVCGIAVHEDRWTYTGGPEDCVACIRIIRKEAP